MAVGVGVVVARQGKNRLPGWIARETNLKFRFREQPPAMQASQPQRSGQWAAKSAIWGALSCRYAPCRSVGESRRVWAWESIIDFRCFSCWQKIACNFSAVSVSNRGCLYILIPRSFY